MSSLRRLLTGASAYLGSVFVGVLFAPVLPDVAVDLFGNDDWRDPLLRLAAVVLVLIACVALYRFQIVRAARRAARIGLALEGLEQREVLVIPVGHRSGYTARAVRTGQRTSTEWLVDSCRPAVLVAVGTPQVTVMRAALREGLEADGVAVEWVELSDGGDPEVAVAEAQSLVVGLLERRGWRDRPSYVDTTGGTVAMSFAMLRVGALLATTCVYVASEIRNREVVPGSQRARAFDPILLTPGQ
ncbi:hypothetical protein [Pseudonocardia oroxyli]|uniref:CRISPR-associated protein (Cas_Cas02710) n=1 Tax=Pseudonocardia oroxyli TaxID=366584 RepID=A0A1G8CQZ9_PSEOR|nr:hypothetical protein [Pseudonocardia oroxyli]SDH47931.1 CRISPR-associated protein (Cas_Cas02710) [Pseudonocardia oroxyli]